MFMRKKKYKKYIPDQKWQIISKIDENNLRYKWCEIPHIYIGI